MPRPLPAGLRQSLVVAAPAFGALGARSSRGPLARAGSGARAAPPWPLACLCAALTLGGGCHRTHGPGGTDGDDGGVGDGGVDDGATVLDDGGVPDDGGLPADGAVRCDEESLSPPSGPPCSEAVRACRRACAPGDEACRDACLDASCRACFFGTIFHCANAAGCEPLWREFACCTESVPMCDDLRGFERVYCADRCPMRFEPYAQCIERSGGRNCFVRAAVDCEL